MAPTNFKVIVVGGGPSGLTAAHALHRAGIDFLVLERRSEIVIDAGSNLVLQSNGLRILSQLGLFDALQDASVDLGRIDRISHQGRSIGHANWLIHEKEFFGTAPKVISRHNLTKVLYELLPAEAQANLLSNKKVSNITATEDDGVIVNCADGTSYEGSIVIASDGAHSMVRDQMRNLALQAATPEINEEKPFLTTYSCLWLRFPTIDSIPAGTTSETHGPSLATQLFAGSETTVIGVYERLPKPTRERLRFSQEDQDALVKRWANLPVAKSSKLTLSEAYAARVQSGLVSLEEGVVEHWSWDGRVVLTGDAAHKFTPSTGQGCNNGIVDIVALVNELHKILPQGSNTASRPTKQQVAATFKAYQASRFDKVVERCANAGQATASATWVDMPHKFIDKYVLSIQALQKRLATGGAAETAKTPILDFVEGEERLNGSVPWATPMKPKTITV